MCVACQVECAVSAEAINQRPTTDFVHCDYSQAVPRRTAVLSAGAHIWFGRRYRGEAALVLVRPAPSCQFRGANN